jgi:hypothetical protein
MMPSGVRPRRSCPRTDGGLLLLIALEAVGSPQAVEKHYAPFETRMHLLCPPEAVSYLMEGRFEKIQASSRKEMLIPQSED